MSYLKVSGTTSTHVSLEYHSLNDFLLAKATLHVQKQTFYDIVAVRIKKEFYLCRRHKM